MKKIQVILLAFILMAIAGKVSLTPNRNFNYAALSTETTMNDVDNFFRYKLNHFPRLKKYEIKTCMIKKYTCCNT
jgi:hypothetical protein